MRKSLMSLILFNMLFIYSVCDAETPVSFMQKSQKATDSNVVFSPYVDITLNTHWDPHSNQMEPMNLYDPSQVSGVTNFHIAFITDSGVCAPAWGGVAQYSTDSKEAWGAAMLKKLKAHHISYTLSFGGANGSDISQNCSLIPLENTYKQIIDTYQPQGLDFDIENGNVNIVKMMQALQVIQKEYPKLQLSFTLPVLPTPGLVGQGLEVVNDAKAANLNYSVNLMAMDYGSSFQGDMGNLAMEAAEAVYQQLQAAYPEKTSTEIWHMIQITPMIGVNDNPTEEFTLQDAANLAIFGSDPSHHLGGISMWSLTRDNPCPSHWANPFCSGDELQYKPYQFSQLFLQYTHVPSNSIDPSISFCNAKRVR